MKELLIPSSFDRSSEPSLFLEPFVPNAPLVVGLHTWSCDRFNQVNAMKPLCAERGWALLLPEFRGPNLTGNPRAQQACASKLAMQDIIDAVDWALSHYDINPALTFLLGGSGGGHMALMTAAYSPQKFAAVSSWVPITNLALWHSENKNYAAHIEACCGGTPDQSTNEYALRSPIEYASQLAACRLFVHHGRYDSSVPFSHTVNLAKAIETFSPSSFFYEIFDGGHEINHLRAFLWFDTVAGKAKASKQLTG